MFSDRAGSASANADDRSAGGTVAASPTLAGLFRLVIGRATTIVRIAAVVFLVVLAGWMLWPAKYTAVALVALDPQSPRLISDREAPVSTGDASAVVSYAEVATSDGFLVALAQQQKLLDDPEFSDGTGGAVAVAAELRRNLRVTRRGLSYLIDISFTAKDPEKAARIANAVATEIVQRQQALRKGVTGGISDALRSRLADLRTTVLASEKAVADYRQENGLLDTSPDASLGLKRLTSLTEQLGPLRARLEDARARYDKLSRTKADEAADPAVFRSDRLTELLTSLGEEKRQLAAASRTYGPRHPSLDAIQARIASIEDAVKSERARILEQAKAEVDVLTEQNGAYEKEIAKRTREQLATEQKQVVLQDLVRQAQADRQIYEQFLARQKTTQEQTDLSQPEAVVVSTAEPPSRSSRPSFKLVAAAGLLGSLGAGVLWVLFGPGRATAPARPTPAPTEASAPAETAPPPAAEAAPPPVVSAPLVSPSVVASEDPKPAAIVPSVEPAPEPVSFEAVAAPVAALVEPTVPASVEKTHPETAPVAEVPAGEASPVVAPPAEAPAAAPVEPPRVSPRRHDPAQRLRRMLRLLTEHDVPLVADLTRPEVDPGDGLAAFADTLGAHLADAPGLVLSVVGTDETAAPIAFAELLADVVAERGHAVAVRAAEASEFSELDDHDLVVEALPPETPTPELGSHAFTLLVVEATREAESRLEPLLTIWESDPDRVLVAAFAPAPEPTEPEVEFTSQEA